MIERADNGVKQRCTAARIDALQRFFQLRNVVAEILIEVQVKIVVEVHHESFVLWVAGLHERQRCFVHPGPFVAHAPAIVDHQPHADRNILALKSSELLLYFVFEYTKIFGLQTVRELVAIIQHAGVQHHQANVDLDDRTLFPRIGILARRKRLGTRKGNLGKCRRQQKTRRTKKHKKPCDWRNAEERKLSGWARNTLSWRKH